MCIHFFVLNKTYGLRTSSHYDKTKVTGAKIPVLAKSAGVLVDDMLLIWGGPDLEPLSPANELYLIKKKVDQNGKFKAIIKQRGNRRLQV